MTPNVILSMVVEAIAKAAQDDAVHILQAKERTYREAAEELLGVCARLDTDNSGKLTRPARRPVR